MPNSNRRTFLKNVGQGTLAAGVGLGLPGRAWVAQPGGPMARKSTDPKDPDWSDWEFYIPNVYDAEDTKILKQFQAELALVNNRGDVNISDLISGKLEGKPGISQGTKITSENISTYAKRYGANNPLWSDSSYAKKTKWGALAMPFAVAEPGYMPAMPKSDGIGDYMVVSAHNDVMSYYKPVYEGDTIYRVMDKQYCTDITPNQGSYYRTFAMYGWGKHYNQKGELVAEGANILKESFRRHKDPAKRNPSKAHAWESPDWWSRKAYAYTDKDWEEIINIWKNEKIRGAETLYWDDVKIGDEPPARAVGPIMSGEQIDMMFDIPDWSLNAKQNILDSATFAKMKKNKQGIYVLPEYLEKKPAQQRQFSGAGRDAPVTQTAELANRDGRAVIQNAVAAKWAAGMIMNWAGDASWLQRIGWDIMELPPGTSKSINFDKDPTVIPSVPMNLRPALFDKYPYMDKVPYMRGCRAAWHAMEGDLVICRGYVTDKYNKNNEYFVDLTFWCQTFDRYLVEEGFATVKLPKKT
jgi:acyl dehydratase